MQQHDDWRGGVACVNQVYAQLLTVAGGDLDIVPGERIVDEFVNGVVWPRNDLH